MEGVTRDLDLIIPKDSVIVVKSDTDLIEWDLKLLSQRTKNFPALITMVYYNNKYIMRLQKRGRFFVFFSVNLCFLTILNIFLRLIYTLILNLIQSEH